MDPVWRESVPYRVRRGEWRIDKPYLDPIATEAEGGNKRLRGRPGDNVALVQQTVRMTPAEFDDFTDMVATDFFGGTARFTMQVWLGSAYVASTTQFEDVPKESYSGRKIAVAMSLRVFL